LISLIGICTNGLTHIADIHSANSDTAKPTGCGNYFMKFRNAGALSEDNANL